MQESNLQPEQCSINKIIQLHETLIVRHGVMLVGPTGSGKSTVLHVIYIKIYHLNRFAKFAKLNFCRF